ncbi:hypothetical protein TVAG_206340 [Trichomonas vaginalis G3]|uniref:Condensin-2 complex subunit H2 C-terminal domain-containing protein n=1 Tax=Trichomonas vaginalis (strain ATCC PRA-98 / G3) TaxID=412133 RepID=A2E1L9_TRIV3|nr:condensin-2 complex subunit H2 family [Trichomonas vaginalis G3]EAY13466.1 hypothetical protein TVAG_206340 [Trichomonas vaginalis G3]KAI5518339.1 condensin-2 complex subunit H2 family [Trichomonas vaginalis G3]|eukprot:XP_001325689.1 hypothetical protein [Trichomonas vaginalis G3]
MTEGLSQVTSQSQAIDPERFQELLRPIRELSAVWNIQLGDVLDTYLENISHIDLSQEFNPDILNFSQAGLLIQGTTHIYAKKVKHLYDLVTNSVTLPETEEGEKQNKKRTRKTIDWVIDDKLAPIEDPDTCDTTVLDTEDPRLEITTMPKIPFCLLHSLDAKTQTGENNYRIYNVPNQENGVIILDGSQKFTDFTPQEPHVEFMAPDLEDDPTNKPPEPPAEDSLPQPDDVDIGAPPMPDDDDLPPPPDESVPAGETTESAGQVSADVETAAAEKEQPKKREKKKKERQEYKLLDPDATNLSFTSHPFKPLSKVHIPTSFDDIPQQPTSFTRPFNLDIFDELFEKVKNYREKLEHEQDMRALEAIPVENGRAHIEQDLEIYTEAPPPAMEDSEEELPVPPMLLEETHDPISNYSEICRTAVLQMIEDGKKQTIASESVKKLSEWEKKISPVLENESKRRKFDITETRKWIVTMVDAKGGEATLSNLTSGLLTHEVSRVFYSSLMLANTNDINIEKTDNNTGDFLIKLLRPKDEILKSLADDERD